MPKVVLREHGQYILPDATEVIAVQEGACSYLLYEANEWERGREAKLAIDSEGRVLRYGRATRWSVDDLFDTGRTAQAERSQAEE